VRVGDYGICEKSKITQNSQLKPPTEGSRKTDRVVDLRLFFEGLAPATWGVGGGVVPRLSCRAEMKTLADIQGKSMTGRRFGEGQRIEMAKNADEERTDLGGKVFLWQEKEGSPKCIF